MAVLEQRLLDRDLNAIVGRLRQPMTAEAALNFYYQDGNLLVAEVLLLRRHEQSLAAAVRQLPLDVVGELPPNAEPLDVIALALTFFQEAQRSLWREREIAKPRRLAERLQQELAASAALERQAAEKVATLTADLAERTQEVAALSATLADLRLGYEEIRQQAAESNATVLALSVEVQDRKQDVARLTRQLDETGRVAATAQQQADQNAARVQRAMSALSQSTAQVAAALREG